MMLAVQKEAESRTAALFSKLAVKPVLVVPLVLKCLSVTKTIGTSRSEERRTGLKVVDLLEYFSASVIEHGDFWSYAGISGHPEGSTHGQPTGLAGDL